MSRAVPIRPIRKHGLTYHPAYQIWNGMMNRCTNVRRNNYGRYGGRGIGVCERWHLIENFIADMWPRPDGGTLERVNSNGNYEPGNCRWATYSEQNNNRRDNRWIMFGGQKRTITDWAKRLCIKHQSIAHRIDVWGWSVGRTLVDLIIGSRLNIRSRRSDPLSRIYIVTDKIGGKEQYVRALSLNGAIRAVAAQTFIAKIASTDEVYQAMKGGADVLDALEPDQVDIDDPAEKDDPGPVPLRAASGA